MSVKITHEFATLDEAITHLAKMRGDKPEAAAPAPAAPKPDGAKGKDKPAATKPTAEAKKDDAAATPQTASTSAPSLDYATEVGPKITAAAKTHRAELVALLGTFDAKSGKDLKPENYVAFVAKLDDLVKPAAEDDLG